MAVMETRRRANKRRRVRGPLHRSPTAAIVDRYIEGVLNGTVIAGELVRLAVKRHLLDQQKGKKRGLWFNEEKAERAVEFFGYLKHSKGEWARQTFTLEPWQVFVVWCLFGWMKRDGTRKYRSVYIEVARKNGKSTWAAGIALLLAFADDEDGAEVYSAATKKEQALIVHSEAERMVRATPELADTIQIYKESLTRPSRYQKFEPISSDMKTLDGLNVHGAVIDELHAHKTRGVFDLIETATGARRQPMVVSITTAGTDQTDASVCYGQHVYSKQVLRGVIEDDSLFAFICALDEKDDWKVERNWYKANPNLGVSKKLDRMRDEAKKAANQPSFLNSFLRLQLNRWTQQTTRWIDLDTWDKNAGAPIVEEALHGRRCYIGIDLSSVSDMTAEILLFPDPDVRDRAIVLCRLWCPEAKLEDDANRYRDQYQAWHRDGWLLTTPGNAIDYGAVKTQILKDAGVFQVQEIAVDRAFQGYQFAMDLADEGLTVGAVSMSMQAIAVPVLEFERRLLAYKFRHGGHPVLRWMADNVKVREDSNGNKRPDKAHSQGKIDGIIGMILALDRDMRNQETESVYEKRGLLTLGGGTNGETPKAESGADVRP